MTFSPSSSSATFMPTMLSLWPLVRRNLTYMIIKTLKLQIFGCFSNYSHICIILPQRSPPNGSRYVFSPALMTREATEVRSCVGVISCPLTFPADLSPGESVRGVESPPNLRRRGRWLTASSWSSDSISSSLLFNARLQFLSLHRVICFISFFIFIWIRVVFPSSFSFFVICHLPSLTSTV